ncbi:TIGR03067 domain-containing protein [Tundrisphaera lichenicola]|uniref:TIGR03067 domain-containing protein n=1 Tax=Tundrisphaera lichenicola TaxID=2029860 RepID=UPI003EBA90A6
MPRSAALILGPALLLVGSLNAFGDPQNDAVKQELKNMAGTWRPVSAENNGFKAPEDGLKDTRRTLDTDGKWTMRRGEETVIEWKVKTLDPTKTPKAIDIEVTSGSYKGVVYLGIYEIDGDTLRICFAMPDRPVRPTDFTAGKGSVRAFSEFKRVKN